MNNNIAKIFFAFREQCIWLRCCYNTYATLYESGPQTKEVLSKTANIFFHDLNIILIEYCWLQMCKVTDPAKTIGNDNLTIKHINGLLDNMGIMTDEIRQHSGKIHEYRNIIEQARHKVISHLDKDTILAGKDIGEHSPEAVNDFFVNLQRYVDAVGILLGIGPLDFSVTVGKGDVIDLISKLKKCV